MAEPAVDPQAGNMVLVAERHWLVSGPEDMANKVRARPEPPPANPADTKRQHGEEGQGRRQICAWFEYRGHSDSFSRRISLPSEAAPIRQNAS